MLWRRGGVEEGVVGTPNPISPQAAVKSARIAAVSSSIFT
jgi:hypothetical protein